MIRAATPADADAIAGVQVRAWKRAYADIVTETEMPEADDARKRWWRILTDGPARRVLTLAFDQDGMVAGFVSVGPGRDADVCGEGGELRAVYVDPPAQGAGVGRALMDAGEARLRDEGYPFAVLWVFAANGMAREVYNRRGWVLEPDAVKERLDRWAPAVRYRLVL